MNGDFVWSMHEFYNFDNFFISLIKYEYSNVTFQTNERHLKLADAARTYILSVAPPGTYVGIVDFDDTGDIVSPLTELTSDQVRTDVSNQVPEDAQGGTCIGCGLEKALHVSESNSYLIHYASLRLKKNSIG